MVTGQGAEAEAGGEARARGARASPRSRSDGAGSPMTDSSSRGENPRVQDLAVAVLQALSVVLQVLVKTWGPFHACTSIVSRTRT